MKQQADELGLNGKDKTKFPKEELKKTQDAKLAMVKAYFERQVENERLEQKRLESEAEEKQLKTKAEERRLEKKWKKTIRKKAEG